MGAGTEAAVDLSHVLSNHRLPIILQGEAAECGLACLAMVSSFYGAPWEIRSLRQRFNISLRGATLKTLIDIADALGMSARPIRLEVEEIDQLKRPAIIHWDLNHFVVLKSVSRRFATIHDPAVGLRRISWPEFSKHFSGVALELLPRAEFSRPPQQPKLKLRDLVSFIGGLRSSIAQILILALVSQTFFLATPLISQFIIDNAASTSDYDLLRSAILGLITLSIVVTSVNILRDHVSLYLGTQLSFHVRTKLIRHVLRLHASWFEKRHIGEILSRFDALGPVQNALTQAVIALVLNLLMATTALALMLIYSPRLAFIAIIALLFMLTLRLACYPALRARMNEGLHLGAKAHTNFIETIRGARAFKLFGKESERLALWQNEQAKLISNNVSAARITIWADAAVAVLLGAQKAATWYFGVQLIFSGNFTVGMLMAYLAYFSQLNDAAGALLIQYLQWRDLDLHLERLGDVALEAPEAGLDEAGYGVAPLSGALELRGVDFRYSDDDPWIFRGADLTIPPGKFMCFVGPSGRGKTTLLKLLTGLLSPLSGEVLVDGLPLRRHGLRAFRDQIGVVMQDDQLFSGTIADNICFFATDRDMAQIEQAAKDAHVHDDILSMPMQYMSLIGDLGSTLSGGQRQRILLARALYRRPRILFLDEGTANLDLESEQKIMETIQSLRITRIIVAHRPAAMVGADRVIRIDGGIVECASGSSTIESINQKVII